MGFSDSAYNLVVKDGRTGEPISSGVSVYVYTAATKTLATTYSSPSRVARTNPTTFTAFNGTIKFWAAATTVDIFLADDRGNTGFFPSVSPQDHSLKLDRAGLSKCFVFPFAFSAGGTETDTGLDFPYNVKIHDAAVEVVTTDATETISIGLLSSETAGDADGILVGASTASAAFIQLWTITDSTTEDFIATPLKGALMGIGSAGTSAANDFGQSGGPGHIVRGSNARSLVYLPSTSDTMAGYGYVWFRHLR